MPNLFDAGEQVDEWYNCFAEKKKQAQKTTICCGNNCFKQVNLDFLRQLLHIIVPLRCKKSPDYCFSQMRFFATTVVGISRQRKARTNMYLLPLLDKPVCTKLFCEILGIYPDTLRAW